MSFSITDSFQQAIHDTYGVKPNIIADGKIHRFGKSKKLWYALHLDGIPAGTFGDWSTSEKHSWCDKESKSNLTPEEKREIAQRAKAQKAKAEFEKKQQQQETALKARQLWQQAKPAPTDHPYLIAKGIQPHHAKVLNQVLLIPMVNAQKELVNLQRIYPNGDKRFLKHGLKQGAFSVFAQQTSITEASHAWLGEGFATAATLFEAYDKNPVVCAFDAGNLSHVVEALLNTYPHLKITICADDDRQQVAKGKTNIGLEKAYTVQSLWGQRVDVIKPQFTPDMPLHLSDFNDLAQYVKQQKQNKDV